MVDNWDILDKDAFTLFNVNTYLFVGLPITLARQPTETVLPMVADIDQVQPLRIHKVNTESRPVLTTNSIFTISLVNSHSPHRFIHIPTYSESSQQNPPLRVTVTNKISGSEKRSEWQFHIAYSPQKERNDTVFHYGMPVYMVQNDGRRYLRVDDTNKWLSVWRTPIEDKEMDQWILFPMTAIYNCLSPKIQRCHFLKGIDVLHANFRCKYIDEENSVNGIANEIKCLDDEGHPVHRSLAACRDQCRLLGYKCSGPPLYRCQSQITPENEKWQSYDQCILQCINPILEQKALRQQKAQIQQSRVPVVTKRPDVTQWFLVIAAISVIIGVMIFIVYKFASGRNKRLNNFN